ncbi:MAG: type II secretory pathway component PulF [Bradymonadia bacterium]|jgi:type II secretory pathway component PulF
MTVEIQSQIQSQLNSAPDSAPAPATQMKSAPFFMRATRIEVAGFFREIAILLNAGYSAPRALRLLSTTISNKDLAETVERVAESTDTGVDLSRSLAAYPWYFDSVMTSIVSSSEEASRLGDGAEYLADLLEEDQELRDRVSNALSYPVVLAVLGLFVVGIMLLFVVPTFASVLLSASADNQLHGMAAVMFKLSLFLRHPLGLLSVGSVIAAVVLVTARYKSINPIGFDRMIGRIPVFGRIMVLRSLTRFSSTLRMLTINGVTLRDALKLARGSLRNSYLEHAVDDMSKAAEEGRDFVEPLLNYRAIPAVFIDMLAVGVESGELNQMLHHMTRSMRARLLRTTDRIMVLIQPLMLIMMGGLVVLVFVSYLFPYFELLLEISRPDQ